MDALRSEQSVFLFRFRLLPNYACSNLNFDRLSVPPAMAVCTRDVLGIQLNAPEQELTALLVGATDLASALLDAHAFCSYPDLPSLDLMAEGWLEVKHSGPRDTVFGYADPSLELLPLIPGHPDNGPFRAAADLLPVLSSTPGLGAAFADFRVARRQSGSYVAFFAFRVLEDIAYTFEHKTRKQAWAAMNAVFKTDEDHWKLLTDAATEARHRPATRISPVDRKAVLDLAMEALDLRLRTRTTIADALRGATTVTASATIGSLSR